MASLKERAGFNETSSGKSNSADRREADAMGAIQDLAEDPSDRPVHLRLQKRLNEGATAVQAMTEFYNDEKTGCLDYTTGYLDQECLTKDSKTYDELLREKEAGRGSNYTEAQWKIAWEKKQREESKKAKPKEASDPTPLLADKISNVPPGSNQRVNSETTKGALDNSSASSGAGLDNLTRESYKENKRLVRGSEMLSEGVKQPMPSSNQVVGEEEGKKVSNLQSCNPAFANAIKPVSDAMGSHADTNSSVVKSPAGANQLMPTAAVATVDMISPHFSNEIDSSFKTAKIDELQHLPSKTVGSVRNLSTLADPTLAVPFEITSDVYGGLLEIMDEISNLIDGVMTSITNFAISSIGGLVDGIFPANLLANILGPVANIANEIQGLTQLLGGFTAIADIANLIGSIAGSLSAILSNPAKLAAILAGGANIAAIVGGMAGSGLGCTGSQLGLGNTMFDESDMSSYNPAAPIGSVIGSVDGLGRGLGNLGAMLLGGISPNIGKSTSNVRNPGQLLAGILPPELSNSLQMLDQAPGLGMVGNMGYSVGDSMDSLCDSAFSKCMKQYAAHSQIVSPLFNKQCESQGGYAQEPNVGLFKNSDFVKGAQGNKGVTMLGPGSTSSQRTFPGSYAPINS